MDERKYRFGILSVCMLVILCALFLAGNLPFYFDDAFISFRITENLGSGIGPYLFENQKVYSSTSLIYPFFNLIPAAIHGKQWIDFIPYWNGLMIGLSFCICLINSLNGLRPNYRNVFLVILSLLPWLFGYRSFIYGNSGLETGLYMLCLATCLSSEKLRTFSSWLIFIRPEGWLAGWAILMECWIKKDKNSFRKTGFQIIASFLLWMAAGYLLFGSPVPQSFFAKANHFTDRLNEIQKGLSYSLFAGYLIPFAAFLFAFYLYRDFREEIRPTLIWAVLYLGFFSLGAAWWPWYLPPLFVAFWYMSLKAGLRILDSYPLPAKMYYPIVFIFFIISGSQLYGEFSLSKASSAACQKRMDASRVLAEYLSTNLNSGTTILLEPLGMLAWYGPGLRILDYPGLASPEMSAFLSELPWKIPHRLTDSRTDSAILKQFKPEAIILWPEEVLGFAQTEEFFKNYRARKKLLYFPDDKKMDSVSVFVRFRN